MQKFNLCLIFIILFCSMFLFSKSEEVVIKRNNEIANKSSNEKKNTPQYEYKQEVIIAFIFLILGSVFVIITNRRNTRDAKYISERAKMRNLFSTINAEIMNEPGEEYVYIRRHEIKTTAVITSVTSCLNWCKTKKLERLYEKYKKQVDGKSYDPNTIEKIISFH